MSKNLNVFKQSETDKYIYANRTISLFGDSVFNVVISLILSNINIYAVTVYWIIKLITPIIPRIFINKFDEFLCKKNSLMIIEIFRGVLSLTLIPLINYQSKFSFIILLINLFGLSLLAHLFYITFNSLIQVLYTGKDKNRLNSTIYTLSSIVYFIGPLIAAATVEHSYTISIVIQAISFFITAPMIKKICNEDKLKKNKSFSNENRKVSFKLDIFKYKKLMHIVLFTSTVMCLTTVIDTYEVIFVTKNVGLSDSKYALLISISGLFFSITAVFNNYLSGKYNVNKLFNLGSIIFCFGNFVFAISTNFSQLIISYFIIALGYSVYNTTTVSILQELVPINDSFNYWNQIELINSITQITAISITTTLSFFSVSLNYIYFVCGSILLILPFLRVIYIRKSGKFEEVFLKE